MQMTIRSYLTSGIAALGVGAIALAPIQPLPAPSTSQQEKAVTSLAVNLAATVDPITAWVNVFETSAANIETLGKFNEQNPNPLLKTISANWATYAQELADGRGNLIPQQIWTNIQTFFQAPWDPGNVATLTNASFPPPDNEATVPTGTYLSNTQPNLLPTSYVSPFNEANPSWEGPQSPFNIQILALQLIAGLSQTATPDDPESAGLWKLVVSPIAPLLRFLNTPYSGQAVSWLGPLLSPVVALTNSFTAVGKNFQDGKVLDAFYELINIPANMTNALLNGAGFLNLAPVINQFFPLPAGFDKFQIGLNLGGLLNSMPQNGSLFTGTTTNPRPIVPPTEWAAGTGLDSFSVPGCGGQGGGGGGGGGIDACDFIEGQPPTGLQNGLFGAAIGLGQFLADKLLVTPPAPGQAVASASAVKPAAAVPAPAESTPPAVIDAPAEARTVVDAEAESPSVVDAPAAAPAPALQVSEAPTVAAAPARVEVPAAPAAAVAAPAPISLAEVEAAPQPEPARASAPERGRGAQSAAPGDSPAAQNVAPDNAPAKHRGGRGR